MSELKLTRSESVQVNVTIDVTELTTRFTDDQLASVGLFRSLRDADIAREVILQQQAWLEAAECEDEDCDCVLHRSRPSASEAMTRGGFASKRPSPDHERAFWHSCRDLLLRRDFSALFRAIEDRAWEHGGVNFQLPAQDR